MEDLNVVVIGGMHHNTLGVIRSLGEAGVHKKKINVLIVGKNVSEHNIISRSKYVNNLAYCDTYNDILPYLLNLAVDGVKRTIICCADGVSEAVISNADKLRGFYSIPETSHSISELMEKEYQDNVARTCGLNIPYGIVTSARTNLEWDKFPCIIKPCKSTAGAGKADIRISYSREELIGNLREIKSEEIQIQEYIQKEMEFQLIGCSLDKGKYVIIPGFTRILRQPKNTNTGYLVYSPINLLDYDRTSVERFIREIGYSGLFSIEFIRDEHDKDYFLEINMRNDGNAYCVKTAGVNLPYIWSYYQEKGTIPNVKTDFTKPIHFIPDYFDISLGIHEKGIAGWIMEFISAESHTLFNWKDMGPFILETNKFISGIVKRKITGNKVNTKKMQ